MIRVLPFGQLVSGEVISSNGEARSGCCLITGKDVSTKIETIGQAVMQANMAKSHTNTSSTGFGCTAPSPLCVSFPDCYATPTCQNR